MPSEPTIHTIVEIPEIAEVRLTSSGVTTYSRGGRTTGMCRLPLNWGEKELRGGFAIDVRGSEVFPGHYGAATSNIYVRKNPGSRADALGAGWTRLPLLARSPYSNFGTSSCNSCLFAQRGGKYLYRAVYTMRGDAWDGPTLSLARMGGNQDISWVVSKQYLKNDVSRYSPVFEVPSEGATGFVTDHRYPWIWFQWGNEVVWFRDIGEPIGFHFAPTRAGPTSEERFIGRAWAGHQDYTSAMPPISHPDYFRMFYQGLTLVSTWETGDLGAPELWWFVKDSVDGNLTGTVTIYRSSWLPGQAVRQHVGEHDYYSMFFQSLDEYAELMAQENPEAMAFEWDWLDDDHIVGRFAPGGGWAPDNTDAIGVGVWGADPSNIRVLRHPMIKNSLTMVMHFDMGSSGNEYRYWNGIVTMHSRDDGKTWGRPYVTPVYDGPEYVGAPTFFQGAAVLDNGQPIVPVTWEQGGTAAVMSPEGIRTGVGFHESREHVYRRSDLNMGSWL